MYFKVALESLQKNIRSSETVKFGTIASFKREAITAAFSSNFGIVKAPLMGVSRDFARTKLIVSSTLT